MKSEKREKKNENRKMKTPVYDGEGWKISPSCPIWESTWGVSMLFKKAALRRFILPAVLRELLLTGCVLKSVVLVHCEETCCCSWSQESTTEEVACPKRALLIRLIIFWKFQKYSLRNPRKFEKNLGAFDLFRTNFWKSEKIIEIRQQVANNSSICQFVISGWRTAVRQHLSV